MNVNDYITIAQKKANTSLIESEQEVKPKNNSEQAEIGLKMMKHIANRKVQEDVKQLRPAYSVLG